MNQARSVARNAPAKKMLSFRPLPWNDSTRCGCQLQRRRQQRFLPGRLLAPAGAHELANREPLTVLLSLNMASPAPGGLGPRAQRLQRLLRSKNAQTLLVLGIFFGGILLMVLPAELVSFAPKERAELNLEVRPAPPVAEAARPAALLL